MAQVTASIRFRRFPSASPEGWEMDGFVLPSGETFGELAHYKLKQNFGFKLKIEPDFFSALYDLLGRLAPGAELARDEFRMVIGRLKDEKWSYFNFAAPDRYSQATPEAEIWSLMNSFFQKRLQERL